MKAMHDGRRYDVVGACCGFDVKRNSLRSVVFQSYVQIPSINIQCPYELPNQP